MVKAWAEKEFRNLTRLWQCGVRCPRPRMLRNHVLLMEFIGKNGVAAPRLKDAEIDVDAAHVAYLECTRLMCEFVLTTRNLVDPLLTCLVRHLVGRMYNEACLVHGDLSEYNILYHQSEVYFIDVSQSVEHDHPASFDFLRECNLTVHDPAQTRSPLPLSSQPSLLALCGQTRIRHRPIISDCATVVKYAGKDCENITNFFFKKGVGAVMTLRELFDFITDSTITSENYEDYLEKMMEVCQKRPAPTAKESQSQEPPHFRYAGLSLGLHFFSLLRRSTCTLS